MTRLDNSSEIVLLHYGYPGDAEVEPIDLCRSCFERLPGDFAEYVTDHPPYSEAIYECFECDSELSEDDD